MSDEPAAQDFDDDTCLACHDEKQDVFYESGHGQFDLTCSMCHKAHAMGEDVIPQRPSSTLCANCHADMHEFYVETGHGKIQVTCVMCHDPHGTPPEDKSSDEKDKDTGESE